MTAILQNDLKLTIRPFASDDYEAWVEVANRNFPDSPRSAETMRYDDTLWDAKFFRSRLLVEGEDGRVIATGAIHHMPWQFHPDKYGLRVTVDPDFQRRGIGAALYERLMVDLRQRNPVFVRSETRVDKTEAVRFLEQRGFFEIQRAWESTLDVAAFDFARFATAAPRAAAQGITITTLEDELRTQPDALPAIYDLDCICTRDEPAFEPITHMPYETWVADSITAPNCIHDAMFLAKDGDRYAGLSFLYKRLAQPGVLQQGFTAVHPDYRGKGVAMALKLQTVKYARSHGYGEIRTGNNSRNRPMLRINEAMGFVKLPVWIEFGKDLARDAA
jgi:GNAT superfamily N-acetyltransferase